MMVAVPVRRRRAARVPGVAAPQVDFGDIVAPSRWRSRRRSGSASRSTRSRRSRGRRTTTRPSSSCSGSSRSRSRRSRRCPTCCGSSSAPGTTRWTSRTTSRASSSATRATTRRRRNPPAPGMSMTELRDRPRRGDAGHARSCSTPRRRSRRRAGCWARRPRRAPSWPSCPETFVSLYPSNAWAGERGRVQRARRAVGAPVGRARWTCPGPPSTRSRGRAPSTASTA